MMTAQEMLAVPPAGLTTVPCAGCGLPSPIGTMTTNGDGSHYCGREGTPGFRELIAACDMRQRVAARRARIDQLMAASEAVPPESAAAADGDLDDDAPANAPAGETASAPAADEQPEAAAGTAGESS